MENNTIGKLIGKIVDTFSVTNTNGAPVTLRVTWDCSSASDNDIRSWIAGNRRIAFARPARALSATELQKCDNTVVMAVDAGKKPVNDETVIAALGAKIANMSPDKQMDYLERLMADARKKMTSTPNDDALDDDDNDSDNELD